jgi:hypothetical protein
MAQGWVRDPEDKLVKQKYIILERGLVYMSVVILVGRNVRGCKEGNLQALRRYGRQPGLGLGVHSPGWSAKLTDNDKGS